MTIQVPIGSADLAACPQITRLHDIRMISQRCSCVNSKSVTLLVVAQSVRQRHNEPQSAMASSVSINLRSLRQRQAYSQAELAELAGVRKVTVARIELGRVNPRPRTIRKLAKALGVEPWQLLDNPTRG